MSDLPLENLLIGIASGDRAAMAALYERVGGRMHVMMRAAIGHARGADECLLETFVDIWRRAGHYDPAAEPAARWITRVASRHIGRLRSATIDESAAVGLGTEISKIDKLLRLMKKMTKITNAKKINQYQERVHITTEPTHIQG